MQRDRQYGLSCCRSCWGSLANIRSFDGGVLREPGEGRCRARCFSMVHIKQVSMDMHLMHEYGGLSNKTENSAKMMHLPRIPYVQYTHASEHAGYHRVLVVSHFLCVLLAFDAAVYSVMRQAKTNMIDWNQPNKAMSRAPLYLGSKNKQFRYDTVSRR